MPWVCRVLIFALGLSLVTNAETIAQVSPEVRDRVVPAVVRILVMAEVTERGVVTPQPVFSGSGTLISATGQILTNWHVVDMADHQSVIEGWEAESAANGQPISVNLLSDAVLILTSDGESPPEPHYIATIAATDESLDLAVLQVTGDGTGLIDPELLNLPFVPLEDSDAVGLGDPVNLFGYPAISDGTLTYTTGVVSGFITDRTVGRVWINTDATMSSGSSGGTAVNREGELIGVPTQGSVIECRPADMNQDGRIDSRDVGCLASPGSIGQLRPINLALNVIDRAGGTNDGGNRSTAPPTPTAMSTLSPLPQVTPTSKPSPTETPVIETPTPTPEMEVGDELLRRLPNAPSLNHADCFGIVDDGTLSFEQLLGRFSGVQDAETRLQGWGWQASAFRQFGCDGPPDGEAGWIDISVHLFADSLAAQEAVDYFAATRAEGGPLMLVAPPAIGDHAAALSGPASNGKEFTIYASQGSLLVRVTGVSPSGIPFINVLTVTQAVLAAQQGQPQPIPTPQVQSLSRPASSYLPAIPAVRHRDCFEVLTEGTYIYGDVADALEPTGLSPSEFDDLGWRDGAYRVFTCDDPPVGRATQIDVVIHQFQDHSSAHQALPYFADTYTPGTNEMRSCDTAGHLVVCVTGRSLTGSPLSDVQFVLNQVIDGTR